jgi:hypothetical protein
VWDSQLSGRHYYEPLEDATWPTYGGISRSDAMTMPGLGFKPLDAGQITMQMLQDEFARTMEPPSVDPQVTLWRARILAGWEKYGTGEPLDPRTVEHLAKEFAKPIEWPKVELKLKEPYA